MKPVALLITLPKKTPSGELVFAGIRAVSQSDEAREMRADIVVQLADLPVEDVSVLNACLSEKDPEDLVYFDISPWGLVSYEKDISG